MQSSLENTQVAFLPPPLQPQCGHVTRAPPIKRAPSNWGSVMQKQGLGRRWSPQHVQGRSPAWSPVQRPVLYWQVVPQLFQHTASGFHGRGTSSLAHFHSCSSATLRITETSPPANTALSTLVHWSRLCPGPGSSPAGRRREELETRVLSHRAASLSFPPRTCGVLASAGSCPDGLPRSPHRTGAWSPGDA